MASHANIMTETPDMDTLGGRMSRARDAKSMSVREVAGRIGVKPHAQVFKRLLLVGIDQDRETCRPVFEHDLLLSQTTLIRLFCSRR